jgi:hypothetical protein
VSLPPKHRKSRSYVYDVGRANTEREEAHRLRNSILRTLVHDSFSFLDDPNVAVMTCYVPGNPRIFAVRSVLDLTSLAHGLSSVQTFERITESHKYLFAVCVGSNGRVRLAFGGRTFLEFTGREWIVGSAELDLTQKLAESLERISLPGFSAARDGEAMSGLAGLFHRIAEAGVGGTFVIRARRRGKLGYVSEPPSCFWWGKKLADFLEGDPPPLLQLARMDGAVLIEVPPGKKGFVERWQGSQVWPRRVLAEKCDLRRHEKEWQKAGAWLGANWQEYRSWGIRRASALAYAMKEEHRRELVVAVSADGPIYFISGAAPYVVKYPGAEA